MNRRRFFKMLAAAALASRASSCGPEPAPVQPLVFHYPEPTSEQLEYARQFNALVAEYDRHIHTYALGSDVSLSPTRTHG